MSVRDELADVLADTLNLTIENKKSRSIDSVSYTINGLSVGSSEKNNPNMPQT